MPRTGWPIGRCVKVAGVTAPEDAKKVGFDYIELALQDVLPMSDAEFEQTIARLRAIGIPAISGYGFMPGDARVVGPDVDRELVKRQIEFGITRAERLGLKMVIFGNLNGKSRLAPEGFSMEEAHRQLAAFGREAASAGARHGIAVLFEPMLKTSTNTINTVPEALELVNEVHDPHFGLLVDFTYMTQGGEDMGVLRKAAKHIRQVEVSNPHGRVYPRRADEADYASFFRALREGGYQGGVSVHGAPSDFFVDAPRAIALLRGLTR